MIFNSNVGITSMVFGGDLWLAITFNSGGNSHSEVHNFSFFEGYENNQDNNFIQSIVIPANDTNVTLKNSSITTEDGEIGQDSRVSLLINTDTGELFLNGVKIGTKSP